LLVFITPVYRNARSSECDIIPRTFWYVLYARIYFFRLLLKVNSISEQLQLT